MTSCRPFYISIICCCSSIYNVYSFHSTTSTCTALHKSPLSQISSSSSLSLSSNASPSFEVDLKPSISSIPSQLWNACLIDDNDENPSYSSSPFLEHAWLACLEESGCVSASTGWTPSHVEIKMNGVPCAFVPLYIKSNSMGEFIFDSEWAQFAMKMRIQYYPKLLCGIPFSPVTCSKMLISSGLRYQLQLGLGLGGLGLSSSSLLSKNGKGSDGGETETDLKLDDDDNASDSDGIREFRMLVAKIIKKIVTSNHLSSVHINFITDEEACDIAGQLPEPPIFGETQNNDDNNEAGSGSATGKGTRTKNPVKAVFNRLVQQRGPNQNNDFIRRTSLQYHWQNRNQNNGSLPYASFEEYLNCFKSKKRITIKRERRNVLEEHNIRIDAIVGRDILLHPGLVKRMFEIYKSTVDKMYFGKQYLTLDFFEKLVNSDFVDNLLFMCARYNNGDEKFNVDDVFAGTFNVIKNKVFYGRYWGCLPSFDLKNLHFEVCYWSAIEYCIDNNFERFEPGAGGGDYKWARGFDPVLIHSAHYISQPSFRKAVREYVEFDNERNIAISKLLNERSAVGRKGQKSDS